MASNESVNKIKSAIRNGTLKYSRYKSKEGERLDIIAAKFLGDARLWWVLAACSNIGWALQIPPGTIIQIPTSLERVNALV